MPTDPLTEEYAQGQESVLELEQRVAAQQADKRAEVQSELSVVELEAELAGKELNPIPDLPLEDDGFINNTWEVTGSAVEQAAEQVVRTLGTITSFAEDVGGKIVVADPENLVEPDSGLPLPFTDRRLDYMTNSEFATQARAYEIATGKAPAGIEQFELPDVDRPDSAGGQMASAFIQWGVVFAATRKAGLGNISGSIVADFAAFDPHEARLADLAAQLGEGNPVFDNAFTQYMSADPTDSTLEGRLKNAAEGLLIGGALETFMAGARWARGYRAAKRAAGARNLKDVETVTPQGPDVARTVDDNVTTAELPDGAGKIETVNRGENLQVIHSEVDDALQNTGLGKKLYDDAIDQAETSGRRLVSDTEVSGSAARVWESMARRGDEIIDQRVTDPDNVIREVNAGDGSITFKTKNGTPLFERVKGASDEFDVEDAARETLEGGKPKETLHDVALRQLKNTLKSDPTKLRAVRKALEDGNYHEAQELLDFNAETVDWAGLSKQVGDGGVDEIRNLINTFSDVFAAEMKSAQGYQSGAETLAKSVGATADDVLKLGRDVKGGAGLAARMAGADTVLYQSTQHLRQLAKKANASGSDADIFELFKQIDLHGALQATIKGTRSEIARALEQMKRISTQNIDDFTEFDALMRDSTGLDSNQRRHLAQKIADLKDMNQINQLTRKTRWQRYRDMWVEVYINGLLSAVSTVMLNNASNMLKLVEGVTERYFAAAIGGLKNAGRHAIGRETAERITFREANAYLYGTMHGLDAAMRIPFKGIFDAIAEDGLKGVKNLDPESFGSVYRAFGGEKPVLDTRMRVDADTRKAISMADESDISIAESLRTMNLKGVQWDAKAVNAIGKLVRIPGRLIVTSDEFFKQITYHQHLASQAYKHGDAMAISLNKKGKQRLALIERTHRNYREFPPEDVRFEAMDHARYQTFQLDLPNGLARDIESTINRHPMVRFVVPFYRTPVNIVKQTVLERSPLGFVKAHKSELFRRIAAGGPEGDIALARLATGSAFMGWAMNMALQGKVTGGGLSTSNTPNSEAMDDIPPYSVEYNGTWYQYNRLEPLGMLMGLGADLALAAEWYQDDDDAAFKEGAALALIVVTSNITDKTWFKGVADMVAAIEDPKRFGEQYFTRQTTTMVTPYSSLLRRINVDHDDIAREAWTWMDNWKANMPGFSEDLPVRYDLLGQPRYKRDYLGPSWASPVASGVERDDPVYQEVARLSFDYRPPNKDLFGVGENVTSEVYSEVMARKGTVTISGQTLHERLETLIDSGLYLDLLSDEGKADAVKGVISGYLRAAKGEFLMENPNYFDDVKTAKEAAYRLKLQ